jgi:hypothetical protein
MLTDGPLDNNASFAARRRRELRRQEWSQHVYLANLLNEMIDPRTTFWTSLENKPRSMLSGLFQKQRGVRSGIPDVLVVYRGKPIFIELKSRAGKASTEQKETRLAMLPAGIDWWMVRSARAALVALRRSGVKFRRWKRLKLASWEGPFADPSQRLPMAPDVAAINRIARWRQRANQKARQAALAANQVSGQQVSNQPRQASATSPRRSDRKQAAPRTGRSQQGLCSALVYGWQDASGF